MEVRAATPEDHDAIWAILEPIFRAGDTYTIDTDVSRQDGLAYWCGQPHTPFVAEENGAVLGTYYIQRNQAGGGSHVCNCAFATGEAARGRGVARAMLEHSLSEAALQGYRAMQFNFVVATNIRAIKTWEAYGFHTVGRLPKAFNHPTEGLVDALVMYRGLTSLA